MKKLEANSLLSSLLILSGILTLLFLTKENWLKQESVANSYYQQYLSSKLTLLKRVNQNECASQKKEIIEEKIGELIYSYQCEMNSLFIKPKPTKDKYIAVDNIENWLDLDSYASQIIYINSLSELPKNSEDDPKIVIARKAIEERLEDHFYGMIITDYHFDITGSKRVYGVLYSTFDN